MTNAKSLLVLVVCTLATVTTGFFVGSSSAAPFNGQCQRQQDQKPSSSLSNLHHRGGGLPRQQGPQPSQQNQCQLQASSSSSDKTETIQRNKFHDYNKPIVLIGTSSKNNELNRLAESFLIDNEIASDAADAAGDYITTVSSDTDKDELLKSIESGKYSWPQFVVLDVQDTTMNDKMIASLSNIDPFFGQGIALMNKKGLSEESFTSPG